MFRRLFLSDVEWRNGERREVRRPFRKLHAEVFEDLTRVSCEWINCRFIGHGVGPDGALVAGWFEYGGGFSRYRKLMYSHLEYCEACGRIERDCVDVWDVYALEIPRFTFGARLCAQCRQDLERLREYRETRTVLNKLTKEIRNHAKNRKHGSVAGVPRQDAAAVASG